jgi:hypothetical protein
LSTSQTESFRIEARRREHTYFSFYPILLLANSRHVIHCKIFGDAHRKITFSAFLAGYVIGFLSTGYG